MAGTHIHECPGPAGAHRRTDPASHGGVSGEPCVVLAPQWRLAMMRALSTFPEVWLSCHISHCVTRQLMFCIPAPDGGNALPRNGLDGTALLAFGRAGELLRRSILAPRLLLWTLSRHPVAQSTDPECLYRRSRKPFPSPGPSAC